MSLKITVQLITDKQKAVLHKLEYYGSLDLTQYEAQTLINELYEEKRLDKLEEEREQYDIYVTYYTGQFFF